MVKVPGCDDACLKEELKNLVLLKLVKQKEYLNFYFFTILLKKYMVSCQPLTSKWKAVILADRIGRKKQNGTISSHTLVNTVLSLKIQVGKWWAYHDKGFGRGIVSKCVPNAKKEQKY